MQVYVLPHLPPALYQLAYPKLLKPTVPGSALSVNMATMSHTSTGNNQLNISGDTSIISGLTQNTSLSRAFQTNLAPDANIQQLLPASIYLKTLMGTDPPPKMDDGSDMCLSVNLWNGCWATCKRVQNHDKALSTEEKQCLMHYLLTQLTKQPAATTTLGQAGPSVPP
jgi:hypothetical protein